MTAVFPRNILLASAAIAMLAAPLPRAAHAQSSPGWFVPPAQQATPAAAPTGRRGRAAPRPAPAPAPVQDTVAPQPDPGPAEPTEAELQQRAANLPQPPAPPLPDIVSTFYNEIATGDAVKVTATGPNAALPAPLTADATYYLIKGAANTIQLASSADYATAGTALTLDNAGTGTLRLTAPLTHTGQKNVPNDFTVTLPGTLKLLPGGITPPAPVMGVLGVPDVMRASSAAQAVDKVIGARKEKLQADVQRAKAGWDEMKRSIEAEIPRMTRDQALAKERALQDRVRSESRALQERNTVIQEAAQVALGQIERTLIGIIRQVAEARGMNMVLHRSQVALNVQEFDITDAVVSQLNKALPTVQIPADNVDPATLPKDWGTPVAAAK